MTTYTDRQKACIQALHDAIFDKCLMDLSDDECAGILAYLESTSPVAGFSEARIEVERTAFEAWLPQLDVRPDVRRDEDGYYEDFDVQRAWRGWFARAAKE